MINQNWILRNCWQNSKYIYTFFHFICHTRSSILLDVMGV